MTLIGHLCFKNVLITYKVPALSKVESNLMQNITSLKDEVINRKDIIIKNL